MSMWLVLPYHFALQKPMERYLRSFAQEPENKLLAETALHKKLAIGICWKNATPNIANLLQRRQERRMEDLFCV